MKKVLVILFITFGLVLTDGVYACKQGPNESASIQGDCADSGDIGGFVRRDAERTEISQGFNGERKCHLGKRKHSDRSSVEGCGDCSDEGAFDHNKRTKHDGEGLEVEEDSITENGSHVASEEVCDAVKIKELPRSLLIKIASFVGSSAQKLDRNLMQELVLDGRTPVAGRILSADENRRYVVSGKTVVNIVRRNCESLKSLVCANSTINSLQLAAVLLLCEKLEEFGLYRVWSESLVAFEWLDMHDYRFPSLKEIELSDVRITSSQLVALFNICQNLKKISLYNCFIETDLEWGNDDEFSDVYFPSLEEVNLDWYRGIEKFQVRTLLKIFPNLRKISLKSIKNIDVTNVFVDLMEEGISLPKLEEIDLSSTRITGRQLKALFSIARGLKKVNLGMCANIANDFLDVNFPPTLEDIDLCNTGISRDSFYQLLLRCKNLRILDVSDCDRAIDAFCDVGELPNLSSVLLGRYNVSAEILEAVLKKCCRLKKLVVSLCEGGAEGFVRLEGTLNCLEYVSLNYVEMSYKQFFALLHKCRNLNHLDLNGSSDVAGFFSRIDSDLECFSSLEDVGFVLRDMTDTQLHDVFDKCRALKTLNLYGCREIGPMAFLGARRLPALRFVNVNKTRISKAQLDELRCRFSTCLWKR